MIKQIKEWLMNKYLPTWAKLELMEELQKTRTELAKTQQQLREMQQYVNGIHFALHGKQININIGGKEKASHE
jgi:hypothetical protein